MNNNLLVIILLWILRFGIMNAQDAEVLEMIEVVNINKKGELSVTKSYVIQINNRRGEDLTHFSINSSKRNKVSKIEGSITTVDGLLLNKLNKKEIKKVSDFSNISFYQDDFIEYFTLRHNTYPYVIHCSYTQEFDEYLAIAYWDPVYNRDYPTKKAQLSITIPSNYKIKIKEKFINYASETTNEGYLTYKWESDYNKVIKKEIYSPNLYELIPRVVAVPLNFVYGVQGSFESWSTFGKWEEDLMSGLNDLPISEKNKVNEIVKKIPDNKEKIKALYYYMQDNTRYINVTLGIGGLKPFPASYVAYNKYGDCKALTFYMKSLLEEAGINSYYSDIYAGNKINPLIEDFPSQQFNHVFLMVPIENDTMWLECTTQNKAFGYVGSPIQNRMALVVNNEISRLIKTPDLKETDVLSHFNSTVNVNLTGKSKTQINYTAKGPSYEFFKTISKEMNHKEQEDYIRESINIPTFDLINWSYEFQDRDSSAIKLKIDIETADLCKKYSDDYVLNALSTSIPRFENPKDRKLPLVFDYPIWEVNTINYILPDQIKIRFMPSDTCLTNSFGQYEVHFSNTDTSITVNSSLKIFRGSYPVEQYSDFFEFIKSIQIIERKNHPILSL